jgi:hypothetical protein
MKFYRYKKYLHFFSLAIVIGICFLLFFKRVIFPDNAFDTINYHFFLGKNGFDNFPFFFKPNEFYPLGMHSFNPIIDIVNYILYLVLGYRLGTIGSLISVIGTIVFGASILYRLLNNYLSKKRRIIFFVSFLMIPVFIVNESLFQIGTYFTDNVYVFFLMVYLYILFELNDSKRTEYYFISLNVVAGFLAGLIMTKLTNIIYIVPFLAVNIYLIYKRYIRNNRDGLSRFIMIMLILGLCMISVNYGGVVNFLKSSNPVFPYYNKIFHSVYYPETSWPFNFGPTTMTQRIFYPFYALTNPKSLGEVKDIFPDIKLLIIFFYVIISYALLKINKNKLSSDEGIIFFIFLSSFVLWQIEFGYSRYGIFLEILGGMMSVILSVRIFKESNGLNYKKIIAVIFLFYMCFQTVKIVQFNFKHDLSWRSTPKFDEWLSSISSKNIFKKYTVIDKEIESKIKDVNVVIQCSNPSSAYFSTVKALKDKPMINLDKGSNYALTNDIDYIKRRDGLISDGGAKRNYVKFAAVANKSGGPDSGLSMKRCMDIINGENVDNKKIEIIEEIKVDNFIGDKNFELIMWTGIYYLNK